MYFLECKKKNLSNSDKKLLTTLYIMRNRDGFFRNMPKPLINQIAESVSRWQIFTKNEFSYFLKNGKCFVMGGFYPKKNPNEKLGPIAIHLPEGKAIKKVVANTSSHVFLLDQDDNYYVVGNPMDNEMKTVSAEETYRELPVRFDLQNGKKIKQLKVGHGLIFAEDFNHNWYCYGNTDNMKLVPAGGDRLDPNHLFLFAIYEKNKISHIIFSSTHILYRECNDGWYGAGNNYAGQLGNNLISGIQAEFSQVNAPHSTTIQKVSVGKNSTYMQDNNGNWYGCGDNFHNQLCMVIADQKHDREILTWTRIGLPNGNRIKNIVPCDSHAFIQDINNDWYGIGKNTYGELGVGAIDTSVNVPVKINLPDGVRIKKLIPATNHTFVLGEDLVWYCAGSNRNDRLGFQNEGDISAFTPVNFSELDVMYEKGLEENRPNLKL